VVAVGAGVHDVHIDYFEIGSPNPAASRVFYGRLFDWEIEETPKGDQPYLMVDEANGGLWDTSAFPGRTRPGPRRTVDDVEPATLSWCTGTTTSRLHRYLGDLPPTEYEGRSYAPERGNNAPLAINRQSLHQTECGSD